MHLFILENYHKLPTGAEKTTKIKDWNETFQLLIKALKQLYYYSTDVYIYQLEDIENAAYLVATCTTMIDVFFFQLRDVKLAYCNKNEGHANCSISCTG